MVSIIMISDIHIQLFNRSKVVSLHMDNNPQSPLEAGVCYASYAALHHPAGWYTLAVVCG